MGNPNPTSNSEDDIGGNSPYDKGEDTTNDDDDIPNPTTEDITPKLLPSAKDV